MIKDSGDYTEFETGAKHDIYDYLKFIATACEQMVLWRR